MSNLLEKPARYPTEPGVIVDDEYEVGHRRIFSPPSPGSKQG